jgi:hypothetical protein
MQVKFIIVYGSILPLSKVVRICWSFSRGQKVSKNSKHLSNEKEPSSTTKIVQRNNYERYNATSQCIWLQIFLFVIVIVLPIPIPADLSQQANSAAADSLTYSECSEFQSEHFLPPRKN